MLTPRENLLRLLSHEPPEWIPLITHVDPYNQPSRAGMDPDLAARLGEVRWGDRATLTLSQHLDLDIVDWSPCPVRKQQRAVTEEYETNGLETVHTLHTPAGDLREVIRRSADGRTSYHTEHLVKGPDDLDRLASVFADQTFEIIPEVLAELRERRQAIGEGGIQSLALPGTPLGMMIRMYAGPETVAYLTVDAPQTLQGLFNVMEDNHQRQFALACEYTEIDAFLGMDDTSTTTQSPAMFEEYCVAYTNRMADQAHAAGRSYWHHSCGLIRDLLPLYCETRMDAVHAYTLPPTGNATIRDGKARLGNGIAMIAGLRMLEGPMTDRAQAAREARAMIEDAAPENNLILQLTAYQHQPIGAMEWLRDVCWQQTKASA